MCFTINLYSNVGMHLQVLLIIRNARVHAGHAITMDIHT